MRPAAKTGKPIRCFVLAPMLLGHIAAGPTVLPATPVLDDQHVPNALVASNAVLAARPLPGHPVGTLLGVAGEGRSKAKCYHDENQETAEDSLH